MRKTEKKTIVVGCLNITAFESSNRVYSRGGCSPTITTIGGGGREPKTIKKVKHENRS